MIYEVNNEKQEINWEATGNERTLQNAKNLLRVYKGEIPYARGIGIDPEIESISSKDAQDRIRLQTKELFADEDFEIKKAEIKHTDKGTKIILNVEIEDVY